MPAVSPRQLALELHGCNQRLRCLLDTLIPAPDCSEPALPVPTPGQMSGLLSQLSHAGQLLQDASQQDDPEVQSEISQYRTQVEQLRALLPSMRCGLLAERARLECERERLNTAAHWAHVSQQTL